MSINQMESYFQANRSTHLEGLKTLLRFPSISALSDHRNDVLACAQYIADELGRIGFEHVSLLQTEGYPVVYADWLQAPGQPTVLVYGHYDVQPVDPLELWKSPPFEPEIRDGEFFARGCSDDKGQVWMHLKSFEALFQTMGRLPVNVKFCIEGEEEIGSKHLPAFLATHADIFKADVMLISDTTILSVDCPTVTYSLRGLIGLQVDAKSANGDLHSGLFGGGVPNAVHGLVEALATLHDHTGRVTVQGFYDDVQELTAEERASFAALPVDDAAIARELGMTALIGEPGYTYVERTTARPTLEINGIYGGFQGEGTKTVIPCEAHAKITCRLVANQDPDDIFTKVEQHLLDHQPTGVQLTVIRQQSGRPYVTPIDHPAIQLAAKAYEFAFGVPALFNRGGGSIAVVETFDTLLKIPVVMMGFALQNDNFHAPNEHFSLDRFDRGLRALAFYWLGLPDALNPRPGLENL